MNNQQEGSAVSPATPSVKDLVKVLYGGKRFGNHVDEVWPNLFIGDMSVANDRYSLWKLGITHVLNAAHGRMYCQGSHDFYGSAVDYYGVPADDSPSFDLSRYFFPSAEYIQNALDTAGARIFVHCAVGVSRSASLVLAYLMIHHHKTLLEAINKVKEHRWIFPNRGFLKQLRALDRSLMTKNIFLLTKLCPDTCMDTCSSAALKGKKKEYLTVKDLQKLLDSCKLHLSQVDEVWPNIYIGNLAVAQNKAVLLKLGITHVLNAAHSKQGSIGNQSFYGNDFVYCGIPADDSTHFDLDVYFQPAADFIHKALKSPDGKVLVHCIMGMSRSSTLVLAYLMIYHHLPLKQALQKLIHKRAIYPNRNFLALLLDLDLQMTRKKKTCQIL
ncbi:dual specificity protein phosphatase PHS1-like [Scomber scombrus]|uniref:Dual specificity phosphatase 29 n=1 Tax=Scomber scombrus TaxID=13677 RepID=A0AAV1NB46_SCOSC